MNKCFEQDKKKFILENTEEFFPSNSAFMDFHLQVECLTWNNDDEKGILHGNILCRQK